MEKKLKKKSKKSQNKPDLTAKLEMAQEAFEQIANDAAMAFDILNDKEATNGRKGKACEAGN